jgi:UPF0755 protein
MGDFKKQETAHWDASRVRDTQDARTAPRRRRRRFHPLAYLAFVLIVSAVLAGCGWLLINDLCSFNKRDVTATVEVTSDDTVSTIADKLKDAGLIQYKWFFRLFASVADAKDKIGMGTYQLNSDMDYRALIVAMHSAGGNLNGDTVRITIPEGYTAEQIIALLSGKGVSTQSELTEAAKTHSFSYDFISSDSQDVSRLEGYLFPDTYDFYVGEKASSALNRLLANFASRMDDDRMAKVTASGRSLEEIITVASLIEKETDGKDQKNIASVIYNRLADKGSHGTYGMLQIDAALLYALPGHTGEITNDDKKVDSPYNLYTNAGLPPTPIANPGLTAIDAALDPAQTDYYFYGLGKDGVHHYFKTYDEFQSFLKSDQYGG